MSFLVRHYVVVGQTILSVGSNIAGRKINSCLEYILIEGGQIATRIDILAAPGVCWLPWGMTQYQEHSELAPAVGKLGKNLQWM